MSDRIARTPITERPDLAADLASRIPDLRDGAVRVFMMNGARVIVTVEPDGWHLSISRHDRDPTWDEIATARYRLLPQMLTFAMYLPPLADYVNLHPHTFHLYEVKSFPGSTRSASPESCR